MWILCFITITLLLIPFLSRLKAKPVPVTCLSRIFLCLSVFILSGFLLAKAYPDKLDLKSFFAKRIGRIFPAYYLCILVYSLLFATGLPNLKLFLLSLVLILENIPAHLGTCGLLTAYWNVI